MPRLTKAGLEVVVQSGAGQSAGFFDAAYEGKGARLEAEVFGRADILLKSSGTSATRCSPGSVSFGTLTIIGIGESMQTQLGPLF